MSPFRGRSLLRNIRRGVGALKKVGMVSVQGYGRPLGELREF